MFSSALKANLHLFGALDTQRANKHERIKPEQRGAANAKPIHRQPPPSRLSRHPIIGVIGAKGGVGATTLSLNLTVALAKRFGIATLIDADLQQPGAAAILGREPKYTLLELTERSHEMTRDIVAACSTEIASGQQQCLLVSPPLDGSAGVQTDLSAVAACLERMKSCSDAWVVDLPKHLDRHLVTTVDGCDLIVLVFEPTLPAIAAANRWLKLFEELGYDASKLVLALNRAGGKMKLVEDQLSAMPLFSSAMRIPNAFELMERCTTYGEPAVVRQPGAQYSVAVNNLADTLAGRILGDE